jgi:DNA-binding MarR family transcriptional regulator/nitrite reductase/ring-hydroxylating ferredoxin subunit
MMKPSRNREENCGRPPSRLSAAFLLAQLGGHAAARFGERMAELKLAPPHAGILRMLAATPAMTQQALAMALRILPSRLVALLDELEDRGLIARRENPEDRRSYALHLTEKGRGSLEAIGRVSREHQKSLLAALSPDEQGQLADLLQRIADEQGLTRGVHPGYSRMSASRLVEWCWSYKFSITWIAIPNIRSGRRSSFRYPPAQYFLPITAGMSYAGSGICSHQLKTLDGAVLWGPLIDRPWHHFQFDCRTGENHFPATEYPKDLEHLWKQLMPLKRYAVEIRSGEVWVDI